MCSLVSKVWLQQTASTSLLHLHLRGQQAVPAPSDGKGMEVKSRDSKASSPEWLCSVSCVLRQVTYPPS